LKEQIEQLKAEEQRLERSGDLARVAKFVTENSAQSSGNSAAAQKNLEELQKNGGNFKEEVGERTSPSW